MTLSHPPPAGINSHLEVIEATRPIGILRVTEEEPAHNSTCAMTSLMYLPRRLHQNPPNAGPSAVSEASLWESLL